MECPVGSRAYVWVPERVGDGEASGKDVVRDRLKREDACYGGIQKRERNARTDAGYPWAGPSRPFEDWKAPGSSWIWPKHVFFEIGETDVR